MYRNPFPHRLVVIGLLLVYAALRLHALTHYPAFIDEIVHIDWADDLYRLNPLTGAANGKLFGLWWMALFGLQGDQALFLVRAATVVFMLVSAALLYDITRRLSSRALASLALVVYALAPYSFFYDRMGLIDPYVTVFGLLSVWLCLRGLSPHPNPSATASGRGAFRVLWLPFSLRDESLFYFAIAGVAAFGAVVAKATGITLLIIPALALLLLGNVSWRARLRGLASAYGATGLCAALLFALLAWRGYRYFGTATSVVGTSETGNLFTRTLDNVGTMLAIDTAYFSAPFIIVVVALALVLIVRAPRKGLFVIGVALLPLAGLLAFATKMSARYFVFHIPLFILVVAVALYELRRALPRHQRRNAHIAVWGLAALWAAGFALPFINHYFSDPATLELPPLDRQEYVSSDAAGFGMDALAAHLLTLSTEASSPVVIGLIANCGALDVNVPDTAAVQIECPELKLDGSHQPAVISRVEALIATGAQVWIINEGLPYTSLEGMMLAREPALGVTRPYSDTLITVYRVTSTS